jgi:3-dehydroquinate dehydratase
MVVEQQHPRYGTLRLPNLPFRFSECDTTIREVAPDLGQHNADVAQSLGFSAAEIDAMQTNSEAAMCERIHRAFEEHQDAVLINAGAWTHYSYGIRDALAILTCPVVELLRRSALSA